VLMDVEDVPAALKEIRRVLRRMSGDRRMFKIV